jgi:quercetin dioxygenase-like cupin family protein
LILASVVSFFTGLALVSQALAPQPLSLALECVKGDCALLRGAPQTAGMRSGLVQLKPGESVGWHTTSQHEEAVVILRGQGEALVKGQPNRPFKAPGLVYVPPRTSHNMSNTGHELLEYVYVVAPVQAN